MTSRMGTILLTIWVQVSLWIRPISAASTANLHRARSQDYNSQFIASQAFSWARNYGRVSRFDDNTRTMLTRTLRKLFKNASHHFWHLSVLKANSCSLTCLLAAQAACWLHVEGRRMGPSLSGIGSKGPSCASSAHRQKCSALHFRRMESSCSQLARIISRSWHGADENYDMQGEISDGHVVNCLIKLIT